MKFKLPLFFICILLISLSCMTVALADGELFLDTFDNMADGYVPTTADGWSMDRYNAEAVDSVEVKTDPLDATNKALRYFKNDQSEGTVIRFGRNVTGAEFGRFEITYKIRFEQLVQEMSYGGTVRGYKYDESGTVKTNKTPITVFAEKTATGSDMVFSWLDSASYNRLYPVKNMHENPDKWYAVKMIVDTNRDNYDLYIDDVLISEDLKFSIYGVQDTDTDGISQLDFGIKMTSKNAGPTIVWLDDVGMRVVPKPYVVSASPSDKQTGVSITPGVDIDFNIPMNEKLVNKSNVKVFEGTNEVAEEDYNVELVSVGDQAKRIHVTFNKELDYKTNYTVKVLKAVESMERNPLDADYTLSFTTKPPAFDVYGLKAVNASGADISSLFAMKNEPVTISVTLKNNEIPNPQEYAVTLAITNQNGDMVRKKIFVGALDPGASIELPWSVNIPADVDSSAKVECYVWQSYTSMKKLYSQIMLP